MKWIRKSKEKLLDAIFHRIVCIVVRIRRKYCIIIIVQKHLLLTRWTNSKLFIDPNKINMPVEMFLKYIFCWKRQINYQFPSGIEICFVNKNRLNDYQNTMDICLFSPFQKFVQFIKLFWIYNNSKKLSLVICSILSLKLLLNGF